MLDLHGESAVAKPLLELAIVPRGPDSEDAARREGRARRGDPFVAVETCVARRRERGRTVVDVEEHRVEAPGVCAQRQRDVSNFDADARILQRVAGKLAQVPTVPVHDRRNELGDNHGCGGWQHVEGCAQREAHAQTAHEHTGLVQAARATAGERRERLF